MKKGTIIWIIVGVLVLIAIIILWVRHADKVKQDAEDKRQELLDSQDTSLSSTKKECRKNCRSKCKQYHGKARRDCKKNCKSDCFSNL